MSPDDYYQLLSLRPSASRVDIKKRYRELSFRFHPDYGGTTEQMVKLNEAYQVLSNPLSRREYDSRHIQTEHARQASSSHERGFYSDIKKSGDARGATSTPPRQAPGTVFKKATERSNPKGHFWQWFSIGLVVSIGFLTYEINAVLQTSPTIQMAAVKRTSTASRQDPTMNIQTSNANGSDNLSSSSQSSNSDSQTRTSNNTRQWRRYRN